MRLLRPAKPPRGPSGADGEAAIAIAILKGRLENVTIQLIIRSCTCSRQRYYFRHQREPGELVSGEW
jgi:hypothetical protein